jgi:hypothetical protein
MFPSADGTNQSYVDSTSRVAPVSTKRQVVATKSWMTTDSPVGHIDIQGL